MSVASGVSTISAPEPAGLLDSLLMTGQLWGQFGVRLEVPLASRERRLAV